MRDSKKSDYFGFMIHFIFGSILGGSLGMWAFIKSPYTGNTSFTPMMTYITAGGLIAGIIAGTCKESFWENLTPSWDNYWQWIVWLAFVAIICVLVMLTY